MTNSELARQELALSHSGHQSHGCFVDWPFCGTEAGNPRFGGEKERIFTCMLGLNHRRWSKALLSQGDDDLHFSVCQREFSNSLVLLDDAQRPALVLTQFADDLGHR